MVHLKARQLLWKAAILAQKKKEMISKEEITKKINQIKYLSEQKKLSRFEIKKEIIHLEKQLQSVLEVESQLRKRKKEESSTITSLKKQVALLKSRLSVAEDKELHRKVEKLSHLLGEMLAKRGTAEEVKLNKKIAEELKLKGKFLIAKEAAKKEQKPIKLIKPEKILGAMSAEDEEKYTERIRVMQDKLALLKQALDKAKFSQDIDTTIKIEEKIEFLEKKLTELASPPAAPPKPVPLFEPSSGVILYGEIPYGETHFGKEIKHDILFSAKAPSVQAPVQAPGEVKLELKEELPLPPPPRIKKK